MLFDPKDPAVVKRTALTNLRIHFLRFNLFPRDSLTDPATERKYYYAVNDVFVNGWCHCGGVAQLCDPAPGAEPGMVGLASVTPWDWFTARPHSYWLRRVNCGSLAKWCTDGYSITEPSVVGLLITYHNVHSRPAWVASEGVYSPPHSLSLTLPLSHTRVGVRMQVNSVCQCDPGHYFVDNECRGTALPESLLLDHFMTPPLFSLPPSLRV